YAHGCPLTRAGGRPGFPFASTGEGRRTVQRMAVSLRTSAFVLACLALPPTGWAQPPPSPLTRYPNLEFPPTQANFASGWNDRVALEYEIINAAALPSLRAALKDESPFVRSVAARALGIRGDGASADALAELVKTDPEYMVRIRAVEALGFLRR